MALKHPEGPGQVMLIIEIWLEPCEHWPPQSTGGPTKGTGRHLLASEPGSGWHLRPGQG